MLREEITRAVYGALVLARFDPRGMNQFNLTLEGFWRSFFAAVLVLPLHVFSLLGIESGLDASTEALRYAAGWVTFPLVMVPVAKVAGLSSSYVPFIIAYNWSKVVQSALFLIVAVLYVLDLVPIGVLGMLNFALLVYVLMYMAFIARTALGVSVLAGVALALFDFAISYALVMVGQPAA